MESGIKKTSLVLNHIACELLGMDVGDRMEPLSSIAARLHVSNGTVQNVLRSLEEQKALHLVARGHLGSFVEQMDSRLLLECAGISSVFCAMPIPYSKRYEGLASGLRREISNLGLSKTGIVFISGSRCRMTALSERRVDAVVMSSLAARHYMQQGYAIEILHKFPRGSYINNHYLITRKGFDLNTSDVIRVGVDEMSYDQALWNQNCFAGKKTQPVPVHYLHVLEHIKTGVIDAAVWSFEDSYLDDELSCVELHDEAMAENTSAVLVARRDDAGMVRFLRRNMNFDNIIRIQQAVMQGDQLPDY